MNRDCPMTAEAGGFASVRFSTRDHAERDRMGAFREHFGRTVVGLDFDALRDRPFYAEMNRC
jgi:hypothetical protein